jgi:hypothetical protein
MPCPNCGAPVRYTNSFPTYDAKKPYGYDKAECLGRVEREGWSTTKAGERKWRVKYESEPCGWKDGIAAKRSVVAKVKPPSLKPIGETPVADEGTHHDEPAGRLFLKDYR